MARILQADNYDRDTVSEQFVLWPMPRERAQRICEVLNEDVDQWHYRVVDDDYVPYRWEP